MNPSGLQTDFYELTMMQGYLLHGKADRRAVFDLFVRDLPFDGGYMVVAGIEDACRFLEKVRFEKVDLDYLRSLDRFHEDFLQALAGFRFQGNVFAVAEGTPVFPLEPLLRVEGTLLETQFSETMLLNIINYQTLIATKAARIVGEAGFDNVLEFGTRRAHGPDGILSAIRAAFIGGVAGASNTHVARLLGIPVKGTMAHSWVMSFESELEAFRAYATHYPTACILLLDTYDTLHSGLPNAITVAREMRDRGRRLAGVRLDSGDLAYLSAEVRRELDAAGFPEVKIVASGDLDEWIIHDLRNQGARIDIWGVGTRLVTAAGDSALTGVYKLAAVERDGALQPTLKVSDNPAKSNLPGVKQTWRMYDSDGWMVGDLITLQDEDAPSSGQLVTGYHPLVEYQSKQFEPFEAEPLLQQVMADGKAVVRFPELSSIRDKAHQLRTRLHPTYRRLLNPHRYKVSVSQSLLNLKQQLRSQT